MRRHLLSEAEHFRETLAHPIRPDTAGRPVLGEDGEPRRYALNAVLWELLSGAVDKLAAGGTCRFERSELPHGHLALAFGDGSDTLELGADDVLRLVVA